MHTPTTPCEPVRDMTGVWPTARLVVVKVIVRGTQGVYCSRCSAFQASKCSLYFSSLTSMPDWPPAHPNFHLLLATLGLPMSRYYTPASSPNEILYIFSPQLKLHSLLPSWIILTGKSFSVSILVTPLNSTFLFLLLCSSVEKVCYSVSERAGAPFFQMCMYAHASVYECTTAV